MVLERRGWQLDKRDSTQHCWKYRRGAGEVLIVNHGGRGWWDPTGDRKGDVFALIQFLEPGINFGRVRQALRDLSGIAPSFPVAPAVKRDKAPELPPVQRWSACRVLSRGSRTWRVSQRRYRTQGNCENLVCYGADQRRNPPLTYIQRHDTHLSTRLQPGYPDDTWK